MSTHTPQRRALIGSLVAGLIATPLAFGLTAPAQANPAGTDLVVQEVYGAGGNGGAVLNADFVELFNPTSAAIALSGKTLQYRSAAGGVGGTVNLTGSVPAGAHFLVQMSTAGTTGAALPTPDQVASPQIGMAAAGGQVILGTATTYPTGNLVGAAGVIDAFGTSGATSFEGAAASSVATTTQSLNRGATGGDTDSNAADFTQASPTPQNSGSGGNTALAATNPGAKTFTVNQTITPFTLAASGGTTPYSWASSTLPAGLSISTGGTVSGTPTATGTTAVTATVTDAAAATASTTFNVTIAAPSPLAATNPGNKTAVTGAAITPFTLAATGGTTPYSWTATGLPTGLSISTGGTVSGTPTAAGTFEVTATVTDAATPTAGTATTTFTYTVTAADAPKTIAEIQGTGSTTPFANQSVTTTGVVTASFPTGGLNGFYIQTGGPDTTPDASDAIFVFAGTNIPAASYPAKGTTVTVTGTAVEFGTFGLTEINVAGASAVTTAATAQPAVVAKTVVPGTDCVQGSCLSASALAAAREKVEGMVFAPTGSYTTTDVYDGSPFPSTSSANFGELGLAAESTRALVAPTDLYDAQTEQAQITARTAYNDAHRIILDDGSTLNYTLAANTGTAIPWFTPTHYVRNNAPVTFPQDVVLTVGFDGATFLPTSGQITGDPTGKVNFGQNRPAAPGNVGGDIELATFNVLNYFPTTGNEFVSSGLGSCTYYTDRQGNQITNNTCGTSSSPGPRGAANAANLQRQQDKIVHAINALDASIVSLEELENSIWFNKDRDSAITVLVNALNADAGSTVWAFAPSPAAADLPAKAEQDVIRTGFIYKPAQVALVGPSKVLVGSSAFGNAREPLAQGFKKLGDPNSNAFSVIVNHFKSKGSGTDDGTGQGNANPDRVAQATALKTFASSFSTALAGNGAVFLTGDFNAYSHEDPVQKLEENGDYVELDSTITPGEDSYNFGGLDGSLDHVFANPAAEDMVSGVDIWNINGDESVYQEYSRFNYNVTNLYNTTPFRSSDHNPEIIGINTAAPVEEPAKINLLNINDFHGRIDANTTRFATTIERLRATEGEANSLFLSAGDNIGASLFASSVQDDDPTLDVLDALDLATSAVGNHEFDQGFADLQNDVKPDIDFTYLGANVYNKGTTTPALQEYDTFEVDGLTVGVIGVVTQETPSLVSPSGVADLDFGDPVAAVNRVAAQLSDGNAANGEADVIVAEYHEGAGASLADNATCAQEIAADTTFGRIARTTSASVDVIFTGHTHKEYACDGPVPGSTKTRPILQTGSYGDKIGQVVLTADRATGEVTTYTQRNVARSTSEDLSFPRVQEVKQITDAALANAAAVGNQPVANITRDITTAYSGGSYVDGRYTGGTRDDRSSESTLGDLVANALRDGVSDFAEPDLGITNPGGLRAELLFAGNTASNPANTDGVVTFAEANGVLPFNNTVAVVELTGAQLKAVLEQQWQTNADGSVPTRPYLQLGLSDNVRITADPTKAAGQRVTSVFVNDEPLEATRTYTVSTLSFLSAGGDNFRAFTQGKSVDTGLLDAQMWRDYLADNSPVSPDFARQQVFESNKPATITGGERVQFQLGLGATTAPVQPLNPKTLDLTSQGSPANTEVVAKVGDVTVGTFPVTNGIAQIDLTVPESVRTGDYVTFVAAPSGTTVTVPFVAAPVQTVATTTTATAAPVDYGQDQVVNVTVAAVTGDTKPSGVVRLYDGETQVGASQVIDGLASITIPATTFEVGSRELTVTYFGSADGAFAPSSGTVTVTVAKATPSVAATASPTTVTVLRSRNTFAVTVSATGYTPTGTVEIRSGGRVLGSGELDSEGRTSVRVGPYASVGTFTITAAYLGDVHTGTNFASVGVTVVKQTPVMTTSAVATARAGTQPTVKVALTGTGGVPTGRVAFTVNGRTATITLVDGKAQYKLPKITKDTAVTVRYNGSTLFNTTAKRVVIRLR